MKSDLTDVVEGLHVRSIVEVINGKANNAPKIIMGYDLEDVLKRTKKLFRETLVEGIGGITQGELNDAWKVGHYEDDDYVVKVNDPVLYPE
jgi:hypothetical protein